MSILPTTDTVLILKTLLESALEENKLLKLEVARLRKSRFACSCKSPVHEQLFQKDKDVHFYTAGNNLGQNSVRRSDAALPSIFLFFFEILFLS